MGSRAVVIVCRDEAISSKRFGVIDPTIGVVYTRAGRPFFTDPNLERQFLERIQSAASAAGLWEELQTDWLGLDCELMPWSMKAQELLRTQYAPTGPAGVHALTSANALFSKVGDRVESMQVLADHTTNRLNSLVKYRDAYRHLLLACGVLD